MRYYLKKSNEFNESLFDTVYSYSEKIALDHFKDHYTPERVEELGGPREAFKLFYLHRALHPPYFFVEGYEILPDGELHPLGYWSAGIHEKTLSVTVALFARRPNTDRPVVADPQSWVDVMSWAKEQGCNRFLWQSHPSGRIWKALTMMEPKINYPVTYTVIDEKHANMELDLRAA
ncbi:MAG: hypothetical protein O3A90_14230 [Proteobacteria bacterium]|nr:hypothetical protein [Pseudomonadota bacterium]